MRLLSEVVYVFPRSRNRDLEASLFALVSVSESDLLSTAQAIDNHHASEIEFEVERYRDPSYMLLAL